ncbi:PsiF family protein [Falsiroseomonas sp. HW251]|uniref:PsiF family protein n=1 Tax=Falsiroseomonas sp. HW251 TaxID=3390998 RepID=UPI003D3197DA
MSRHPIAAGILACALGIAPALAQAPGAPPGTGGQGRPAPSNTQGAQQDRMRNCNAEAGTRQLAGDARRDFMSECLAGRMPPAAGRPSAAQQAQQDRMRRCNDQAGSRQLTADARRAFMSDCLAGRDATGATPATPSAGSGGAARAGSGAAAPSATPAPQPATPSR